MCSFEGSKIQVCANNDLSVKSVSGSVSRRKYPFLHCGVVALVCSKQKVRICSEFESVIVKLSLKAQVDTGCFST